MKKCVPIDIVLHKIAVVSSMLRREHVPNEAPIFNIKQFQINSFCLFCTFYTITSIGCCLFVYWISAQIICHAKLN